MSKAELHYQAVEGNHTIQITVRHTGKRNFTVLGPAREIVATGTVKWGQVPAPVTVVAGTLPKDVDSETILRVSYDMYRRRNVSAGDDQ